MLDLNELPAGLTNEKELAWLQQTVMNLPYAAHIIELGSWLGRSAVAMHSAIMQKQDPHAAILCIDTWHESYGQKHGIDNPRQVFLDNTDGCTHLGSIEHDTADAVKLLSDHLMFDMIFIDADHTYDGVTRDLEAWYPRMKNDAVICGHDFRRGNGVESAVKHFCITANRTYSTIKGGTIWALT